MSSDSFRALSETLTEDYLRYRTTLLKYNSAAREILEETFGKKNVRVDGVLMIESLEASFCVHHSHLEGAWISTIRVGDRSFRSRERTPREAASQVLLDLGLFVDNDLAKKLATELNS